VHVLQDYHDDDRCNSHLFFINFNKITKVLGIIRNSLTAIFSNQTVFSERERRQFVCLSAVRLSFVTFVHPTQAIEIFGNVSMPFNTLAIR